MVSFSSRKNNKTYDNPLQGYHTYTCSAFLSADLDLTSQILASLWPSPLKIVTHQWEGQVVIVSSQIISGALFFARAGQLIEELLDIYRIVSGKLHGRVLSRSARGDESSHNSRRQHILLQLAFILESDL